ncbi:O-antigen ligase family protein [Oceanimonas sp. CHS3-5]|uniref:O-antigen ligase family protein n=1 Tax=Oceanimonas sp. CHS3-5 TaxID=3068186 RepID=UPI00273EE705|nr:O-antigen ligase family protein [Oceanimonas sp. CHS3-5]MDP5291060.1 O-antigen ligase family protein [Oceanimonas sp. CHS3-5]
MLNKMMGGTFAFMLLAIMLAPSLYLITDLASYDYHRVLQILLFSVLLLAVTRFPARNALSGLPCLILFTCAALGILSAYINGGFIHQWTEVGMMIALVAGADSVARAYNRYPVALESWVKPAWLLGALVYSLLTVAYSYHLLSNAGGMTGYQPMHGFANPRFLNQYQGWFLPVLTGLLLMKSPPWLSRNTWECLVSFGAVMHWALIWQTQGRGVMVGLIASTLLVALFMGKNGRRYASLTLLLSFLGALIAWLLFKTPALVAETTRLTSSGLSRRDVLWADAIGYVESSPWLGIGPMQLATGPTEIATHPHNAVLQMAAEWGVPATLLLCMLLLWGFYRWFIWARSYNAAPNHEDSPWLVALTASMTTAAVHSLVSGIIVMPMSQLMLVLVLGLAIGLYRSFNPIRSAGKPYIVQMFVLSGICAVMVLGAYAWSSKEIPLEIRRLQAEEAAQKKQGREITERSRPLNHPRFWVNGIISD